MIFNPKLHTLTMKTEGAGWLGKSLAAANETGLKVHVLNAATALDGESAFSQIPADTQLLLIDDLDSPQSGAAGVAMRLIKRWGSVNEKCPQLQAIWASCGQETGDYTVQRLDPALVDSFDIVQAMPSPEIESPNEPPTLGL